MPSLFSKHLHLCFFKVKYPQQKNNKTPLSFTETTSSSSESRDSTEPDFASIVASQRFFFSSPGTSNSIVESPDTGSFRIPNGGGIRVPKYSLNPYLDFLRSMQEMIHSRQALDISKDSDYLHELLLCYLALNPPHTHKYILRAFTDLLLHPTLSATLL